MDHLADDLPRYRVNILAKIADVRGAGKGGSVEKLQETIDDIKTDLGQIGRRPATARGPSSSPPSRSWFLGFRVARSHPRPVGDGRARAGDGHLHAARAPRSRDRLIGLFGQGRLTVTTKAFDEAGTRVSRQLLMQSLVNLVYGIAAGVGLSFLGVPYPLVWGALGAALRFIPYVGPCGGAGAPILVSLAALPGWAGPLWVLGLFVVLELFTNMVLETCCTRGRPASPGRAPRRRSPSGRGCGGRSGCSSRRR